MRPEQNTSRVYWARLADRDHRLLRLLDPVEHQRFRRYARPADADRFLLGAAMLRILAAERLGCPPERVTVDRRCPDCAQPHGKPRIPGCDLRLSVSHSGDLVGVAHHIGADVGLDVEQRDPRVEPDRLAETVLAPPERQALAALPEAERLTGFLRYWTRKEALVKATGEGLRTELREIVVSDPDQPPAVVRAPRVTGVVLRDLAAAPGHLAALAVHGAGPVRVAELPAEHILRG